MIQPDIRRSRMKSRLLRLWNKSWRVLRNPPFILSIILLITLTYLVIAPLVSMLHSALTFQVRDSPYLIGRKAGDFTTYYLTRTFSSNMSNALFYKPLINTLVVVAPMSLLALCIGGILAFLVVRTDLPGKEWVARLAIVPYTLPSWTLALAWLTVFKNRTAGGSSGILEYFGVSLPDWVSFGPVPIIITMALHYYPFSFLLIGSALRDIDTRLEESAFVLGADRKIIMRKIVLPLVAPSVLSGLILTMARGIGSFSTPSFLGMPVNYQLLSTRLYSSLQTGNTGVAHVVALVMILLAVVFIYLNQRVIGTRKGFVTITGKASTKNLVKLGKYKTPIQYCVYLFLALVVFVPIAVLGIDTVTKVSSDGSLRLTLDCWIGRPDPKSIVPGIPGVFRNTEMWRALWNSLRLGIMASLLCAVSGLLIGYTVVRLRGSLLAKCLDQISFLPYSIPSIAFGAIYLSLFAKQRGIIPSLYGTFLILVLITTVKNLPFATRAGISGMLQLGHEIEEAGIIQGAGWFTRMRRLIFPLQSSGMLSGILLPLISAMRELSLIIMLITPGTQLLTTLTFKFTDYGYYSMSNALLLINIFVVLVMTVLIQRFTGGDLTEGLGSED